MTLRAHRDKSTAREVDDELGSGCKRLFGSAEEEHRLDWRKGCAGGSSRARDHDMSDDREVGSMVVRDQANLSVIGMSVCAISPQDADILTYGFLVFSHVTRNISTVHSALKRRN